ncbi:MAG TPA: ECF-type sigma factor [Gemmatimonadaceae bacterium]
MTALLLDAESGEQVWSRLLPVVYDELRLLARRQLAREGGDATLVTTELVHEAWLRLADDTRVTGSGRNYFFGAAARAMRQVLVDHARRRQRLKRGGGDANVTLHTSGLAGDAPVPDLLELDDALNRLAEEYPRAARVVECRFFAGMDTSETAAALDMAPRTVKRDWALARAWLYRRLHSEAP